MKHLMLPVVLCYVAINAPAQIKTGTIVVVHYTSKKIIFAADSLVTGYQADGSWKKSYNEGKIATFGKKVIFSGYGAFEIRRNGGVRWFTKKKNCPED